MGSYRDRTCSHCATRRSVDGISPKAVGGADAGRSLTRAALQLGTIRARETALPPSAPAPRAL
jgi:hypothetical protein